MDKSLLSVDLDNTLDRTRDLWQELRGEHLFITGGTGFIGCWLLESFAWINDRLNLNAQATVLTRNIDSFRHKAPHLAFNPAISYHLGDIRSFEFPQTRFSHIIHAATDVNNYGSSSNPLAQLDSIEQGTRRVLDLAITCQTSKFLLTSSGAVYGKGLSKFQLINEMVNSAPDPTNLRSIYGEAKRISELLCTIYSDRSNLETKIARCFSFTGAYLPLDSHLAISSFLNNRLNHQSIQLQGIGTTYRSYLYAGDLITWLWTILFKGKSAYPYNVGSEQEITMIDLAKTIAMLDLPNLPVHIAHPDDMTKSIDCYVPSTQRARETLGLEQLVSLEQGLQKSLIWYKQSRK